MAGPKVPTKSMKPILPKDVRAASKVAPTNSKPSGIVQVKKKTMPATQKSLPKVPKTKGPVTTQFKNPIWRGK
jgi:hypothetical protein